MCTNRLTSHSPFTAESESKLRDQICKADINVSSKPYLQLSPEGINETFKLIQTVAETYLFFL